MKAVKLDTDRNRFEMVILINCNTSVSYPNTLIIWMKEDFIPEISGRDNKFTDGFLPCYTFCEGELQQHLYTLRNISRRAPQDRWNKCC